MNILDLIQGFIIGGSLIITIGPQNLFVIQQGLKNNYVLITVLICSFSDALLIIIALYRIHTPLARAYTATCMRLCVKVTWEE